jgi:cell division protein FtsZ
MENRGGALMGLGVGHGENRGIEAVEKAINSPLLDNVSIRGAKGIIVNVTGGNDLTLYEVDEIISLIRREADEQAQIIFGTVIDEKMQDQVNVTVLATGFPQQQTHMEEVKSKEEKKMVFTIYAGNDLDIPTFQRRRLAEKKRFNCQSSSQVRQEDLDIPTFLRRESIED